MDNTHEKASETEISFFETRVCVIGLGRVGLELARLFSAKYKTTGFDSDHARVKELMAGHDSTLAVSDELLQLSLHMGLTCTADIEKIRRCNFYIVAIPAPADGNHRPDLRPLLEASVNVGKVISGGDIVVFESAVCPYISKKECIPVIEKLSGLTCHINFFAGCSPGLDNLGEKEPAAKIRKCTFFSTPEIGRIVEELYAGLHHP